MQQKSKALLTIIIILIVAIYSGYYLETENLNKPQVKIAVSKTPLSAPFYIAEEQNFFKESCVDVQLYEVVGGKRSFEQVMQGKADFGTSSDSVLAFKGLQRSDFVNLATFVSSDNDVKFVTRESTNVQSSKDLLGKTIGLTKGAAGDYFLSTFLALGDVSSQQVKLKYLAPDKLEQALLENIVDVIVAWEPYAYKALQSLDGDSKLLQTKNLHTLTFNLVSRRAAIEANFDNSLCILEALQSAINFIATNPERAKSILVNRLGSDSDFIQWVWPDYIFKLSLHRSLLMNLESQATWAIENGLVSARNIPDFNQMIAPKALKKVSPMAVSFNDD